jgi:cell division protein FtsL
MIFLAKKSFTAIIAIFILFATIVCSGVSACYVSFLIRQLHNEIKQEMDNTNKHQLIWSNLILEYNSLTSIERVHRIATTKLNMMHPSFNNCQFLEE